SSAGRIPVEAQDWLVGEPPKHFDLVFGERGSHWRDRLVDSGGGEGDGIHLALDHDDAPRLARGRTRTVQVEQRSALVEQRCIWRIQVLGSVFLIRVEYARGKGDNPAARVVDRDRQPPAEAVVRLTLVGRDAQAGFDQHRLVELAERGLERVAAVGGESE